LVISVQLTKAQYTSELLLYWSLC